MASVASSKGKTKTAAKKFTPFQWSREGALATLDQANWPTLDQANSGSASCRKQKASQAHPHYKFPVDDESKILQSGRSASEGTPTSPPSAGPPGDMPPAPREPPTLTGDMSPAPDEPPTLTPEMCGDEGLPDAPEGEPSEFLAKAGDILAEQIGEAGFAASPLSMSRVLSGHTESVTHTVKNTFVHVADEADRKRQEILQSGRSASEGTSTLPPSAWPPGDMPPAPREPPTLTGDMSPAPDEPPTLTPEMCGDEGLPDEQENEDPLQPVTDPLQPMNTMDYFEQRGDPPPPPPPPQAWPVLPQPMRVVLPQPMRVVLGVVYPAQAEQANASPNPAPAKAKVSAQVRQVREEVLRKLGYKGDISFCADESEAFLSGTKARIGHAKIGEHVTVNGIVLGVREGECGNSHPKAFQLEGIFRHWMKERLGLDTI